LQSPSPPLSLPRARERGGAPPLSLEREKERDMERERWREVEGQTSAVS